MNFKIWVAATYFRRFTLYTTTSHYILGIKFCMFRRKILNYFLQRSFAILLFVQYAQKIYCTWPILLIPQSPHICRSSQSLEVKRGKEIKRKGKYKQEKSESNKKQRLIRKKKDGKKEEKKQIIFFLTIFFSYAGKYCGSIVQQHHRYKTDGKKCYNDKNCMPLEDKEGCHCSCQLSYCISLYHAIRGAITLNLFCSYNPIVLILILLQHTYIIWSNTLCGEGLVHQSS